MTTSEIHRAVAGATGESLRTVRGLGFGLDHDAEREPEDLCLNLDCPFCGCAVPYPGTAGDGSSALAECLRCDVYFDFAAAEVYASGPCSAPWAS